LARLRRRNRDEEDRSYVQVVVPDPQDHGLGQHGEQQIATDKFDIKLRCDLANTNAIKRLAN
jgi:hypothetical protein